MPVKFDSSWEPELLAPIWNWLCCTKGESKNELRNEINELYEEAKTEFAKLKKTKNKTSQRAITKREWELLIDDLEDKPITYAEGLAKRDSLHYMNNGIFRMIAEETAEASRAKPSNSQSSTVKDEFEDDEAFAAYYAGPSVVTATQPIRLQPRRPPTPAEVWANRQRDMETDCAQVQSSLQPASRANAGFGAHPVNQTAVLNALPKIANATWSQGRPNNSGSEVRVFIAVVHGNVVCTVWTHALSHDTSRRANTHTVYERVGENAFSRLSVAKHPLEHP